MPNLEKYHPKPCATCGHQNLHGEVAGCTANTAELGQPAKWCPCEQYQARTPEQVAADRAEGVARGVAGADAALHGHALTYDPDQWREKAEARLEVLIGSGVPFSAEDITAHVGVAPSPNAIGGLFRTASFKARCELVRIDVATRPEARGRALRIWRGRA